MRNLIKIRCEFSFRGQIFTPTLELNLDEIMTQHRTLPDLYPLLAEHNQIGLYSYEYEMLEAEPLVVEALEGWVAAHIEDNRLDADGFVEAWHRQQLDQSFKTIVDQHGLDSDNALLMTAMQQAYQLGLRRGNR